MKKSVKQPLTAERWASLRKLNDWADKWSQDNDSAITMWGTEQQLLKIKKAVDSGLKVISLMASSEDDGAGPHDAKPALMKMIRPYRKAGFRTLAIEDNFDSAEAVLAGTADQFRQVSKAHVAAALEHSAKQVVASILES